MPQSLPLFPQKHLRKTTFGSVSGRLGVDVVLVVFVEGVVGDVHVGVVDVSGGWRLVGMRAETG